MPRVQAGEIAIHYEVHGQGEPLLLINGFASSSASWRPELLAGLARSFRVIAFDNRGTGQSDHPDTPWTLAQMADDAAALLDALAVRRAHVFGLSMGGMIAQELTLRHPHRVLGLVLGCTNCGAPLSVPAAPEVVQLLMVPEGMDPREAARRAWPASYTPEFIAAHRDILEQTLDRVLAHPTPPKTRRFQMEAIRAWSSHERLHQLTAPTLIITGDRDVLIPPENARILHERIAGSRLHVIPGAAHNFAGSHPEETVRLVTEFLREVSATVAAD
jgi:pimeloyl-ACP methyl ester carboxylesterase